MKIKYFARRAYGRSLYYLLDPHQAELWYRMTGNQTLTQETLKAFMELTGFEAEQVPDPVDTLV